MYFRATSCSTCWRPTTPGDFGREVIPASLANHRVNPYLFRGYWADVGTVDSFYDANIMLTRPGARFNFYDPHRPIYTHPRFLPGSRLSDSTVRDAIVAEGCFLDRCAIESSVIGIRTSVQQGATIRRSVLLGADYYEADDEAPARGDAPKLGIGRDVQLDRVIVDKNARIGDGARLLNTAGFNIPTGPGTTSATASSSSPKMAVVAPGTVV